MEEYIYIDENKKGTLAISKDIIIDLVNHTINSIEGISPSKKVLSRNQYFSLNHPVKVSVKKGITHIKVAIDVIKGMDIAKVTNTVSEEITNKIYLNLGHIPFDVNVQVESII